MTPATSVTRIVDGILLTQTGPVHREIGGHRTACGTRITVPGAPVSPTQVAAFDLPICAPCYPERSNRRGKNSGPRGGAHRR
jgi:hypothetical protein